MKFVSSTCITSIISEILLQLRKLNTELNQLLLWGLDGGNVESNGRWWSDVGSPTACVLLSLVNK